jgi:hypothetical protein
MGTYTVSFGPGIGATSVTAMGDTETCLVDPSPADPNVPRLNLKLLDVTGEGFKRCRRGDQTIDYYLLENNDNQSVSFTLTATTNQVARMPTGSSMDTLFAISNPNEGTDNFPQEFADMLSGDELISLPDPSEISDQRITRDMTLGPYESRIIGIAIRSDGMCADGSCSETLVKITGTFSDGSPALACAGTAVVVEDVEPKSLLCEVTDTLNVGSTVDARWSPAVFDGSSHHVTHFEGNLTEEQGGPGTQTTGSQVEVEMPFPPTSMDTWRTENPPQNVVYSVDAFPESVGFQIQTNEVTINNFPEEGIIRVPLIGRMNGSSNLSVMLDGTSNQVTVMAEGSTEPVFQGNLADLIENPPEGYFVDMQTCRKFDKSPIPDKPLLGTDPKAFTELFDPDTTPDNLQVDVLDLRNDQPLSWNATIDNSTGVSLVNTSGSSTLELSFDLDNIVVAPNTTMAMVTVSNDNAINSPVAFPVAVRQAPDSMMEPEVIGGAEAGPQVSAVATTDTVLVKFSQQAEDGMGSLFLTVAAPQTPGLEGIEFARPTDETVRDAVSRGEPFLKPFIVDMNIVGENTDEYYFFNGPLSADAEDTDPFVVGGLSGINGQILDMRMYYLLEGQELTLDNLNQNLIQRISLTVNIEQ